MFTTIQQCKKLYKDIILGYSYVGFNKSYIKHFTESDFGMLEDKSQEFIDYAISKGINSEKDTLIYLANNDIWTTSEEQFYQSSIQDVRDLSNQLKDLYLKEQIEQLSKIIKTQEGALDLLHEKRMELLSVTAESYAGRKHQEELVKLSFYKDPDFKELTYDSDAFDELDVQELRKIFLLYNSVMLPYCDKNLQKISICPFFLNLFSLCEENTYSFYGKPICRLSIYQAKLLEFSTINSIILKDEGKGPPDDFYKDLNKAINWFDSRYQILVGKSIEAKQKNNRR